MAKQVLGHIDCPACFTPGGVRVTADRNGKPFGFCEANCNFQMRIGGNAKREEAFAQRYPWVKAEIEKVAADAVPVVAAVPIQVPEKAPAPVKPAPKLVAVPKSKPKDTGPFAFLLNKEGAPA